MAKHKNLLISYMQLRTLIGFLGILLPFICIGGSLECADGCVKDSISMYYYGNMRDVFVGILICVSLFLMTYRGYETVDNVVTTVTGIAGILIALFPCENALWTEPVSVLTIPGGVSNCVHLSAAGVFFILLAFTSIFLFTKSDKAAVRKSRKEYRNVYYRVSGWVILIGIAAMLFFNFALGAAFLHKTKATLIVEAIMLLAFGSSWLVKGGTILKDRKEDMAG